jgi:RNA polymerase sigma factor (sigma-70 family)
MAREATAGTKAIPMRRDRDPIVVWSDEQLLQTFLSRSDESAEAAFATLVARHVPIVHRVCLDVLRHREEARDAAQAVFLVLARKAGSIRKPEALGPWLHGVALRLARRARADEARRRAAERRKGEIMRQRQHWEAGLDPVDYAELHEEVDRLPEKYRSPIILCYLQGRTQVQAAEELGWPLGTVQVRLHRGRDRLRSRLTRRGIGPMVMAGFGLATSSSATAGMPGRAWTDATAAAAVRFASGKRAEGLVEPVVTRMAESTLAAMFRESLKVAGLLMIALCLSSGIFLLTGPRSRREAIVTGSRAEPEPAIADTVAPRPTPTRPARKAPIPTLIGKAQAKGSTAERRERLEERPAPRVASRDPLNSGEIQLSSYISPGRSGDPAPDDRRIEGASKLGLELFERVWEKDDPRSHGGDGLGPVFNGTSCAACHHLGGSGGAGGVDRNIEIATPTPTEQLSEGTGFFYAFSMDFGAGRMEYRMGDGSGQSTRTAGRVDSRTLATIHPGFRESPSVVLHSYGTDPAYNAWRSSVSGRHGTIVIRTSERNPPPLFGAGLIDAITDEAIEAAARRKHPGSSEVRGRVSRLRGGRIGRFGWKAQTATLKEFVLSAAAGEMGLEVPGKHQAADPRLPGIGAPGLDMDAAECDALTEFVRSLPTPVASKPADKQEAEQHRSGERTFRAIGCANCHLPKLGSVSGIYSDLLLHDMGGRLEDAAAYSVFVGAPPRAEPGDAPDRLGAGVATATIQEWRTPPLWGLRESGPYLHDGRAATIDQAIAMHAGQGASAARRYAELSPARKRHLATFLRSLAAPAANQ